MVDGKGCGVKDGWVITCYGIDGEGLSSGSARNSVCCEDDGISCFAGCGIGLSMKEVPVKSFLNIPVSNS